MMRLLAAVSLCLMMLSVSAVAQTTTANSTGDPDFKTLLRIALAALDACESRGFHVSVVVANAEGNPKIMLRGDGAAPHTPDSARRKAFTAASFGVPTAKLVALAGEQPDIAGMAHVDNIILVGGGVPIRIAKKLIGGIGVAGSAGIGQDEACARAGLPESE